MSKKQQETKKGYLLQNSCIFYVLSLVFNEHPLGSSLHDQSVGSVIEN